MSKLTPLLSVHLDKDLNFMADVEHRPTNFIRQIIDADLASGKHNTTVTRFPPEPNGYLHRGRLGARVVCDWQTRFIIG